MNQKVFSNVCMVAFAREGRGMADTEYTLVDGAVLLPRSFPPNWLRYFLMFPRLERHGVEVKVGDTVGIR